jgi:hypothetical protein
MNRECKICGDIKEEATMFFKNDEYFCSSICASADYTVSNAGGVSTSSSKSVYDIAVENGFTGTVGEWLASLKGIQGNGFTNTSILTPATTGTMTVPMNSDIKTITPSGNCTFNASGGTIGNIVTFHITTSGTASFTLTFGTNFRKTATLATGTTTARFFSVTFRCIDGTIWSEICRTAAQT